MPWLDDPPVKKALNATCPAELIAGMPKLLL
jgi:hypothetical protein